MNVVLLSNGYRKGDDRTRVDFIKKLQKVANLHIYGPKEYELDPVLAPIDYSEKITYFDVIKEFQADVFIIMLHSPDAMNFDMQRIDVVGVPFVVVEEDHYTDKTEMGVKVLDWYKTARFALILRRHCYKPEEQLSNSVWFPFSANEEEFFEDPSIEKQNIIGFAGSWEGNEYYDIRKKAIAVLLHYKLIDETSGRHYGKGVYVNFLRSHVGCLSCSGGILHTCLAKTFEIPLCGAALLSNKIDHSDLLFDGKECYFEYKDNCRDLIEKVKIILHEPEYVKEVVKNAQEQIRLKHTDSKRIVELYNILDAMLNGKELPRIWGQ